MRQQVYIFVVLSTELDTCESYVGFPCGICQDVTRMLLVKHAYAMDDSDWHAMMQCQICEDPLGCNQCYSLLINYATTNFFLSLYLMQSHNCHMVVVV